jgi:hypothetical protein
MNAMKLTVEKRGRTYWKSLREVERDVWNRCDVCGKFIAMDAFGKGAVRKLIYPDSELTKEAWETLCVEHADD